ncbi:lipid-A-disaccharide synthase [Maritalea sp.]|uniref:lipid-A-disaccharide synthase n=1 Tax=Maritalea sp. TaxID=2003361 RepID=UPI003EF96C85
MRLFVVAGESSGDQLGADLVTRLRLKTEIELFGVGGPALEEVGIKSLFSMSDLAVMGWRDVYMRLPKLLWRLKQTADAIIAQRPDIVVLIDSQEFSNRIAARVRKALPDIKIILYVAPSVWAWKPERAKEIEPLYNELLGVLPFEPAVFKQLGGPVCHYVGHIGEGLIRGDKDTAQDQFLLLPGSRAGEIKRNLAEMKMSVNWLHESHQTTPLCLATVRNLSRNVSEILQDPLVAIGEGRETFKKFVKSAKSAIAVSGTATLEIGFADVPHVTTYLAEPKQIRAYEENNRPLINLNNIIVGRKFIPEVIGMRDLSDEILREVQNLMGSDKVLADQRAGLEEMRTKMKEGEPEAPRQNPEDRVIELLN